MRLDVQVIEVGPSFWDRDLKLCEIHEDWPLAGLEQFCSTHVPAARPRSRVRQTSTEQARQPNPGAHLDAGISWHGSRAAGAELGEAWELESSRFRPHRKTKKLTVQASRCSRLDRLEILDQIPLFSITQFQTEVLVIVVNDRLQRRETPIMIKAALVDFLGVPKGAQGCGTITPIG